MPKLQQQQHAFTLADMRCLCTGSTEALLLGQPWCQYNSQIAAACSHEMQVHCCRRSVIEPEAGYVHSEAGCVCTVFVSLDPQPHYGKLRCKRLLIKWYAFAVGQILLCFYAKTIGSGKLRFSREQSCERGHILSFFCPHCYVLPEALRCLQATPSFRV